MDNRAIGMFDSGIGGITVLKEVKKLLPNEKIIYLGDTKRFPYGSKSKDTIIEISRQCVKFLISKNVKLIIIACGTATSQSLDILKKEFDIPIIGIIEPTVKYIKDNRKNEKERIGVIATSGTIKSGQWERKIKEEVTNIEVINEEAPLLATMAEQGWINNKVAEYTIKEYMKCFKNIDKLILGCTHYPLFERLIRNELKNNTEIINTGTKVAEFLKKYIEDNNLNNDEISNEYKIFLTDLDNNFNEISERLLEESLKTKIEKAEI